MYDGYFSCCSDARSASAWTTYTSFTDPHKVRGCIIDSPGTTMDGINFALSMIGSYPIRHHHIYILLGRNIRSRYVVLVGDLGSSSGAVVFGAKI